MVKKSVIKSKQEISADMVDENLKVETVVVEKKNNKNKFFSLCSWNYFFVVCRWIYCIIFWTKISSNYACWYGADC